MRADGTVARDDDEGPSVGRYLKARTTTMANSSPQVVGEAREPAKKKVKTGGFGNFDAW